MRLNSLTSLRFFAALGVFIHHFEFFAATKSEILKKLSVIFFEGFVGVTFFYVLSGFIISYSYEQHRKKGTYRIRDFFYNRFSRLYPVHIATLILAIFAYIPISYFNTIDITKLIANALLIQSAIANSDFFFSFNGVSWSVSTEMFFYISFVFLVTLNTKQLLVIGGCVLSMIIFHIVGVNHSPQYSGWLFYINPAFRVIDFIVGMLLCRLFMSGGLSLNGKNTTTYEIASILLMVVFIVVGMKYVPMIGRYDIYYIIPMAMIVYVFAFGNGAISKLMNNRVIILLGEASFSLYMIHQIWINVAFRLFPVNIDSAYHVLSFMLPVVIAGCLISCVMFIFYERPINNFLRSIRK